MNWLLIKNSFFVAGLTTVLAVSLGFVAALWVTGLQARSRNFFLALALMALALPPFLVTNCWLHFLGHTGVWRGWLPFGTGTIGDWFCHVIDPSFWALNLGAPTSVHAEVTDYDPKIHGLTYPPATKITFEFPARK